MHKLRMQRSCMFDLPDVPSLQIREYRCAGGESERRGERLCMCGEVREGEESLHPLTHPPTFVLFWPFF